MRGRRDDQLRGHLGFDRSQLRAWPWSLLERPLTTRTGICAQMPPYRPRIGRELVTGSGKASVETPCNLPAFERAAGLICKQEVAGSIPAGSTEESAANWLVCSILSIAT
jgi:hypothetical protein